MISKVRHLIGGKEVDSVKGKTFLSINPATGEDIAEVAEGQAEDVDLAVQSAHKAFEQGPWRRLPPWERGRLLRKVADIIRSRTDELAIIDTLDAGKPIKDTRTGDIPESAYCFEFYGGVPDKIRSAVTAGEPGYHNFTVREPYGVVGCIMPWNFPFINACLKVAPALAAGNTVVLKMAEQTPVSTLELGKICLEAGIPAGVVNVVHGFGPTAGAALVRHPLVRKISFTGSTSVGKEILRLAADGVKSVILELGGKTPNIVFADADLQQALPGTLFASFFNMGQVCITGSRLLVQEQIADDFLEGLVERAKKLKVGDPTKEDTRLGPLVSEEQYKRVEGYIRQGVKEGAELVIGGSRPQLSPELQRGYFLVPTIFRNVDMSMRIAREEIFGPVLSVLTFKDEDEAVHMANDVSYGLAASIWTNDLRRAFRMAQGIDAGIIWTNTFN